MRSRATQTRGLPDVFVVPHVGNDGNISGRNKIQAHIEEPFFVAWIIRGAYRIQGIPLRIGSIVLGIGVVGVIPT